MTHSEGAALLKRAMLIEDQHGGDSMHLALECAMLEDRLKTALKIMRIHPINYGAVIRVLEGDKA